MDMDFLPDERPMEPVAVVRTDFPLKFGLPRQSGLVPSLRGTVVFEMCIRDRRKGILHAVRTGQGNASSAGTDVAFGGFPIQDQGAVRSRCV